MFTILTILIMTLGFGLPFWPVLVVALIIDFIVFCT